MDPVQEIITELVHLLSVIFTSGIFGTLLSEATRTATEWLSELGLELAALDWLLPVAGLLVSLVLQVFLLFAGQLRMRTRAAKFPGWVAYVGSDIVAAYILGLMSRSTDRLGLYGLWAALLVYHLGGPDNFTAYERADSELWKRHMVNLIVQVFTASHIIFVDSRGWILIPTVLVFSVGFIRYWERNAALQGSSRAGITKAMAPLYKFMETEGELSPPENELNYIVAGAKHWYSTMQRLCAENGGRFFRQESYEKSKPDLVTTADLKLELNDLQDPIAREWGQWLVVASACSSAYLRRVVGLCRLEQNRRGGGETQLRSKWFEKAEQEDRKDEEDGQDKKGGLAMKDWMDYMQIEQDFLYSHLYTKPADPNGNLCKFAIRIFSSYALIGSLLAVYFISTDDTWQNRKIFKVATYVVLLVGVFVEIGYMLRLLFSKGAVVAMLVHLVKAHRANGDRAKKLQCIFGPGLYAVEQSVCVWLLRISKWWESVFLVMHNKTYVPGSRWEKGWQIVRLAARAGFDCRELLIKIEDYIPGSGKWERGWEMVRVATPTDTDCRSLLNEVEAAESDGIDAVLKRIRTITQNGYIASRRSSWQDPRPVDHNNLIESFGDFYDSDWEHVLLLWWIATLKVLSLQQLLLKEDLPIEPQYKPRDLQAVAEGSYPFEHKGSEDNLVIDDLEENSENERAAANAKTTQMVALWLMVYVCHLLTVSPELLPTHLELTKSLVAKELVAARKDIRDPSQWVRKAIDKNEEALNMIQRQRVGTSDVQNASSVLALLLLRDLDLGARWDVLKISASHFIAMLAQTNKLDEHCTQLTQGGELLTTLWILSSHLGGGMQ